MSSLSMSSPVMSDKTLLLSVEDLISIAMGPREGNIVNFKMIQTILHILARQMRVLEQKVVLVAGELPVKRRTRSRVRDDDGGYRRRTPPEFETEEDRIAWEKEEDERQLRRSSSRSKSALKRKNAQYQSDDEGGYGGGKDKSGGGRRGRPGSVESESSERRGHGRSGQDSSYDDEHGGRGRSGDRGRHGRDNDDRGRRGRSGGRGGYDDSDERGGRDRSGGGRGGRGRDDDDQGGRGRSGGRGGHDKDDDDEHGGRGRAGGGRGGRDRDDDDERGGRGRSGGGRGGHDDDERGSHDRAGGRGGHDDERGHDRAGGRGHEGERGSSDERGRGRGHDRPGGGTDVHGGQGGRDDAEQGGKQGIGVREIHGPGNEKLLVVEKGPTTVGTARDRRDSIAVVTQSQFQLLEEQVDELWRAAGPLPELKMPDNKKLREELAAGASLTDAMQAMQVSARVQAAEQAITKLGGLLTQLAASGALPEDAAGAVMAGGWMGDEDGTKSTSTGTGFKSIQVEPSSKGGLLQVGKAGGQHASSKTSVIGPPAYITKPEMGTALGKLREEVTKTLQGQIDRAATAAETAEKTAKTVGDKIEELLKMDSRLNSMYSMVDDYSEQLHGFDAGLNTQMASFKEQMTTMRAELQEGLQQLDTGNSNPETAAVMELNERFEGLVRGLDDTLLQHTALDNMQHQLTQELKTLVEGVEVLREQKADRDELLDILRDKADITMLDGLVRQEEFDRAQVDLEQRLDQCNDKFTRQDLVWMDAIKDLRELADTKAQLTELLKVRDEATIQLRAIDDRIDRLALILGEPKAAMLMRKLARDAVCASCLAPALMDPGKAPMPPALPAARGPALEAPCGPEPKAPDYPDFRTHRCRRWVGGSHTLLPAARAHPQALDVPDVARKYTGYGDDGRLYWMETEMQACVECNPEPSPSRSPSPAPAPAPPGTARTDAGVGAGDSCEC